MRILVDMNLSPLWIPFLQQHGFEATHWSSVGAASAADAEIMDHARARQLVIFTHDLDFGMLLAMSSSDGPSVVQIRTQDVLPPAVGSLVVNALNDARLHLDAGALVTIDPMQHRIRLLPIRP
jgi:predicted nuclease of predicted toxin-antitoxin system